MGSFAFCIRCSAVDDAAVLCVEVMPEAVVLDSRLPDGDGVEAAERILTIKPSVRIIVLTAGPAPEIPARAAGAGISGLLPMNGSLDGCWKRSAMPARERRRFILPCWYRWSGQIVR